LLILISYNWFFVSKRKSVKKQGIINRRNTQITKIFAPFDGMTVKRVIDYNLSLDNFSVELANKFLLDK
jgi:hypothetical protein